MCATIRLPRQSGGNRSGATVLVGAYADGVGMVVRALLLALLELLAFGGFAGALHAVFTVREEVGITGAVNAADGLSPDCAAAVDTIPAGDTPEIDTDRGMPARST